VRGERERSGTEAMDNRGGKREMAESQESVRLSFRFLQ